MAKQERQRPSVDVLETPTPRPDRMQEWLDAMKSSELKKSYGGDLLGTNLRYVSSYDPAEDGQSNTPRKPGDPLRVPSVTFTFTVIEGFANAYGILHGGATATMFDFVTTLGLGTVAKPGMFRFGGVSRTLNVTYQKAATIGEEIEVTAEVISIGRRLASTRAVMRKTSDGSIVATCEHNKVNTDPEATSKI